MLISYGRTIVLYLLLIMAVRLMGKRQLGQMEPAEFVVAMLIANLASIPMQNSGIPLYSGLVPIFTVLGMQLVLAGLSLRCLGIRRLLCGKPVILIADGVVDQRALGRSRVTIDELQGQLRQHDVLDVSGVQYAILETNGQVSVFPYPETGSRSLPITLVSDGVLMKQNLPAYGRDRGWVGRTLRSRGAKLKQTFLLTVDEQGNTTFIPKEASK